MQETHIEVHEFLNAHPVGVLSTVDNGKPWGSAIYFVADEEFNCFFITRVDTLKFKNIDKNAEVALTVADPEAQTTVQLSGTVSKVPANQIMDVAFHKIAAVQPKSESGWAPPIMKIHKGDYMVLQITPSALQYANYSGSTTDIHHEYIKKII